LIHATHISELYILHTHALILYAWNTRIHGKNGFAEVSEKLDTDLKILCGSLK